MENNNNKYIDIPKEKFEFVNTNEKLTDKKFIICLNQKFLTSLMK